MWTAQFWKDAIERAVKTAAQVALGLLAGLNLTDDFNWETFLVSAGITVGLSIVTSLLSSLVGNKQTASVVGSVFLTVITSTWFMSISVLASIIAVVHVL